MESCGVTLPKHNPCLFYSPSAGAVRGEGRRKMGLTWVWGRELSEEVRSLCTENVGLQPVLSGLPTWGKGEGKGGSCPRTWGFKGDPGSRYCLLEQQPKPFTSLQEHCSMSSGLGGNVCSVLWTVLRGGSM